MRTHLDSQKLNNGRSHMIMREQSIFDATSILKLIIWKRSVEITKDRQIKYSPSLESRRENARLEPKLRLTSLSLLMNKHRWISSRRSLLTSSSREALKKKTMTSTRQSTGRKGSHELRTSVHTQSLQHLALSQSARLLSLGSSIRLSVALMWGAKSEIKMLEWKLSGVIRMSMRRTVGSRTYRELVTWWV